MDDPLQTHRQLHGLEIVLLGLNLKVIAFCCRVSGNGQTDRHYQVGQP